MELYDVVMRLVGKIEPVGETYTDKERYENLISLIGLTDKLVTEIDRIGYVYKNRQEASIKKAAERCQKFMSVDLGIPK